MTNIIVQPAGLRDSQQISEVQIESHKETYSHLIPKHLMHGVDFSKRVHRWKTKIIDQYPYVWVAVDGGNIIGWATSSTGRDLHKPCDWEVEGLYVLASYHGSGVGQKLLDAAMFGHDEAFLWRVKNNKRAAAFYNKNGFIADGATNVEPLYDVPLNLVRMVKKL